MGRGRPQATVEELLARGTFVQRQAKGRVGVLELGVDRPKLPKRPKIDYVADVPIDFDDLIEANYDKDVSEALDVIPRDLTKRYAKRWCWDESDELALSEGCRFDLKRAMHFAYTLRNELILWEGRWSGEPFILRTWQIECLLRVFGWVRPDKDVGWVRRFSKAAIWVPKKSGKSPTGAAIAIYCWRFDGVWVDGEPRVGGGQHVYCVARNGKQAQIVWNHSKNMTHHSPRLKNEVSLNQIRTNEMRSLMVYTPKLSNLTTVTGDNPATRSASEGLVASAIICDEAHVVDKRMVEITTDAMASQLQGLWFQISTFGDSEGYGYEDVERGRDVAAGRIKDSGFFYRSYQAPQDSTDEDCGREEIWKEANPNLGYTVSERQFRESYERAKEDPGAFAGFKQRRLNIWQRSSNPMFHFAAWEKCAAEIPQPVGVGGGAGIDLAQSEDWAALSLAWEVDDLLHVFVRLWATEDWIMENDHRAPFQRWVREGYLQQHEGSAIDFERIQTEVIDILKKSRTGCLGFDYMFAMQMAQNIEKKIPRLQVHKFTQSVNSYAQSTAELKNAVKNGTLRQPGNPALDWQAGHVKAKTLGDYEMPVRDTDNKWQKIDGIQAVCMAIRCRLEVPERVTPYVGIV